MENPFIKYWLWYYDVLWHYWPIVVVLMIIAMWLMYRRFAKRESLQEASNLINVYKEDKDNTYCAEYQRVIYDYEEIHENIKSGI